jgi:5-methyltetrahydrofolate--homocysteine methyltransferase
VVLYDEAGKPLSTVHFLRQQVDKREGAYDMCLADFIAPESAGYMDYMGGFAVTSGHGVEDRVKEFEARHDDYNAILLKALADRLAEAFAERMHERVRKELWGYAPDEDLSNDDLIREKYPACPDHSEKPELFRLLNATENTGITLSDNFAMWPASSVSGYYIAHPDAQYFGIGKIGRDQVADYAARRGMTVGEAERWLSPNLAYDRER